MTHEKTISQLNDIYFNFEDWHNKKLSRIQAWKYHEDKINRGELITVSDADKLVGYVEFSINHGCCFVQNLFILPDYRRTKVIWMLKRRLFEICKNVKPYFGERNKNGMRYPEFQLRRT